MKEVVMMCAGLRSQAPALAQNPAARCRTSRCGAGEAAPPGTTAGLGRHLQGHSDLAGRAREGDGRCD